MTLILIACHSHSIVTLTHSCKNWRTTWGCFGNWNAFLQKNWCIPPCLYSLKFEPPNLWCFGTIISMCTFGSNERLVTKIICKCSNGSSVSNTVSEIWLWKNDWWLSGSNPYVGMKRVSLKTIQNIAVQASRPFAPKFEQTSHMTNHVKIWSLAKSKIDIWKTWLFIREYVSTPYVEWSKCPHWNNWCQVGWQFATWQSTSHVWSLYPKPKVREKPSGWGVL